MANTQHFVQAVNNVAAQQKKWVADLVDDLTAVRASVIGIAAKLDADGGVTDTDYAATWTPAALKTVK